jgi:hypothetical protein
MIARGAQFIYTLAADNTPHHKFFLPGRFTFTVIGTLDCPNGCGGPFRWRWIAARGCVAATAHRQVIEERQSPRQTSPQGRAGSTTFSQASPQALAQGRH